MIKNIILLLIVFSFTSVYAASLKSVMKAMGNDAKVVAVALKGGMLDQNSLSAAEDMKVKIAEATKIFPDAANTKELQDRYVELMTEVSTLAEELIAEIENALATNPASTQSTANVFKKIMDLRKVGHDEFDI